MEGTWPISMNQPQSHKEESKDAKDSWLLLPSSHIWELKENSLGTNKKSYSMKLSHINLNGI